MKSQNETVSAILNEMSIAPQTKDNDDIFLNPPIIFRSFQGTVSDQGEKVAVSKIENIDINKPWRQIIKRSFINDGSDN